MLVDHPTLEKEIKARAASLGFSLCGIASPEPLSTHANFVNWLQCGLNADMDYLASPYHVDMRRDPAALYPGVKSIIVLGMPYPLHPLEHLNNPSVGLISGYATGEDYHVSIPTRLAPLVKFMTEKNPSAPTPRIYTDSAPILERELAVRAGLGWIGRNSCLISHSLGSNFLLAEIFTGIPFEPDQPYPTDRCGNCTRCMDACPTNCILPNRTIDSNRCLSYHSIENKGDIPPAVMEKFGSWIFGCDICQMVCPWNHRTVASDDLQILAEQMSEDEMLGFLQSSPIDFDLNFAGTAIARTRYRGLMRNIIIRLANMKVVAAAGVISNFTNSQVDPVLRRTTVWALELLAKET